MFLKKVKIKGFKSFAKTINFKFNIPITAIVGPNGSGKSNVVDAVRWVLGEQSAKNLRGSEMADVIFAGSEKLPPSNSAEVSLYLDNSQRILDIETDEVKISREVTDDGQSDYLINDSKCRLKDVNELLMDTGLGNNSYSIVSQGKITQIINSKPENLRELFEEAAGISKHKSRKKDAERRLEKTNSNLQRIKDLVWELEKQFNKIEKEAKKAREYKKLKSELKDIEINLLLDQHDDLLDKLKIITKKKNEFENEVDKKEKINAEKKETLHKKKEELRDVEISYDEKRDEYYNLKTKSEETKNRINIIKERKSNLKREKNELEIEIKRLKKEINQKSKEYNNLNDKKEKEIKHLNLLEEKKDSVEKDYKIRIDHLKGLRNDLNSYRENLIEENVDINQLRRDFDKLEEKIKYKERTLSDLNDKKENILKEKMYLENKLNNNKDLKKETSNRIDKTYQLLEKLNKELENYVKEYNDLENEYENLQDNLYQKKSRREFIEDLKKEYSGFYKGVKNILKEKQKFKNVDGAVAELIEVKKDYETAIETTLGNRLQNIVVKDDNTAQKCIDFLKEKKAGRATFLPLNSIKSYGKINVSNIKNTDGFLGLAKDFVDYDKKYKKVIEFLIGNIIITDNLDSAIEISNLIDKNYKVVTLEGDVIFPGGSVSGGSRENKKNNLLNREREIKELDKIINEFESKIEKIVKKGLSIKDKIKDCENKIDEEENLVHKLELKLENINENSNELKQQIIDKNNEIKEIKELIYSENNNLKTLKDKKNNLNSLFEKNSQNYDQEKDIINEKQVKIDKLSDKIENTREKLTEVRVEYATQQEKIKNLRKDIFNLEESINNNKSIKSNKENRIEEINQELEDLTNRTENLFNQREEFIEKVKNAEKEVKQLDTRLTSLRKEHENLEAEVENLNELLNEKKELLHKINLNYTRKTDRVESIEERLLNEYEFDVENDIYHEREKVKNPEEVEKRVQKLRDQIDKLGNVNIGSIKEYEELKERLDYLHEQQDDLKEAQNSINNIINRIEETMENKFKNSFYQIKKEFEEVFVDLFNGGRAELTLVDENNLLETGVEIIAQPPGKKLKKLTLLSGGERALTAIALVFALLRVNPSPFYILDEIDAPLDDVNVVRFSNFIKEYSDFAQFIVVTHRKHMMTSVDNIYGLTMTDKGVTELVSLNIKEQIQ